MITFELGKTKPSELLAQELAWTQGTDARNKDKIPCPYHSQYATSWCMNGAILKCRAWYFWSEEHAKIQVEFGWVKFNDSKGRTQEEVVAKLQEFGL